MRLIERQVAASYAEARKIDSRLAQLAKESEKLLGRRAGVVERLMWLLVSPDCPKELLPNPRQPRSPGESEVLTPGDLSVLEDTLGFDRGALGGKRLDGIELAFGGERPLAEPAGPAGSDEGGGGDD